MSALPNIVYLDGLVALGGHAKFAGVIIIDGQNVWDFAILGLFSLEELFVTDQRSCSIVIQQCALYCGTLVGLKFATTSLTGEVALTLVPKVRVMFN